MSLDIAIKVDPGDSAARIDGVTAKLSAAEQRARAAGAAMSEVGKAFQAIGNSIRDAFTRAAEVNDRLIRQGQPLVQSFGKIREQLLREKQVLEQIRAPQQQYFDRLTSLDKLLERNMISTREYADEVKRMNQEIDGVHAPAHGDGGGGGHGGGILGAIPGGHMVTGLAAGGIAGFATEGLSTVIESIGKIGEAARESAEKMREMRDTYVEIANEARKFSDGGHTTNQVIADQQSLSHDLHSNLEQTIGVYDAVHDGSEELNLTYSEQLRLTRSLGEAFQLANKPLGDAGGLMAKLSYAMASGQISAGELSTIMKQVPPLADLWTKHFGVSRTELARLVESGKIGVDQLAGALIEDGSKIDAAWKGNTRTIAQWRGEFKHAFDVARGSGKDFSTSMDEALRKTADSTIDFETRSEAAGALASTRYEKQLSYMKAISAQGLETADSGEAAAETLGQAFARIQSDVEKNINKWNELDAAAERVKVTLAFQGVLDPLVDGLNQVSFALGKVGDALNDSPLNRALRIGQDRAAEIHDAKLQLDGLRKAHELNADSVVDFKKKERDLLDIINGVTESQKRHRDAVSDVDRLYQQVHGSVDQAIKDLANLEILYAKGRISLGLYNQEVEKRNNLLLDAHMHELEGAGGVTAGVKLGSQQGFLGNYIDSLVPADSAYDQEAFDKGLQGFREAVFEMNDKIAESSEKAAAKTREAWASGLGSVVNDMIKTAATGEKSWDDMLDELMRKLIIMAAQTALMSAGGPLGAFGGAALSGLGGFASGGTYAVPYDTDRYAIPHAAVGWNGMIGGSGGTDSKLFQAMVTPGETVHINTPRQEQEYRSGRRGGGMPSVIPVYIEREDPRDLVPAGIATRQGKRALANAAPRGKLLRRR